MKKKEIGIALLAVSAVAGVGIALKKIRDHREEDKKQTRSRQALHLSILPRKKRRMRRTESLSMNY